MILLKNEQGTNGSDATITFYNNKTCY